VIIKIDRYGNRSLCRESLITRSILPGARLAAQPIMFGPSGITGSQPGKHGLTGL